MDPECVETRLERKVFSPTFESSMVRTDLFLVWAVSAVVLLVLAALPVLVAVAVVVVDAVEDLAEISVAVDTNPGVEAFALFF